MATWATCSYWTTARSSGEHAAASADANANADADADADASSAYANGSSASTGASPTSSKTISFFSDGS